MVRSPGIDIPVTTRLHDVRSDSLRVLSTIGELQNCPSKVHNAPHGTFPTPRAYVHIQSIVLIADRRPIVWVAAHDMRCGE